MSDEMNNGAPGGESVSWIVRQAAERRGLAPPATTGDDNAIEAAPAVEAPVSKFRRVSGAPAGLAVGGAPTRAVARPVPAMPALREPTASYRPPPPPPPMEWDSEVDTIRPTLSSTPTREYALPPSRSQAPSSGPSPYSPTPSRRKRGGGVVAAAVAGALVIAIGGVTTVILVAKGGSPSRAEFVADADDVCRPANGPVAGIVKPSSYPELATAAGTLTTTIDAQIGQLRALDQPGGKARTEVAGIYTALEGTSAAAGRLQDAAGRQDDAASIAATKDMAGQAGDARSRATTTGFTACSIGMQTGVDAVFGGTQSIIKTGFVAQADVLCRRAANEIEDEFDSVNSDREFVNFIGNSLDVFDELVADVRALPVAPGDEATVAEILTLQEKVQAKGREFEDAAADEDFDRIDAIDREVVTLTTAADAKWDAYGLGSCGSNFGF